MIKINKSLKDNKIQFLKNYLSNIYFHFSQGFTYLLSIISGIYEKVIITYDRHELL